MAWISASEQGQHWQALPAQPETGLLPQPGTIAANTEQAPEMFSHMLLNVEAGVSPLSPDDVQSDSVHHQVPLADTGDDTIVAHDAVVAHEVAISRATTALPGTQVTALPLPLAERTSSVNRVFFTDITKAPVEVTQTTATSSATMAMLGSVQPAKLQPIQAGEVQQQPAVIMGSRDAVALPQVANHQPIAIATQAPDTQPGNCIGAVQHIQIGLSAQAPLAVPVQPEPVAPDTSQRPATTTAASLATPAHQEHQHSQTERLQAALGARLQLHIANRTQSAHIRLDPPSLGKIDIQLHMEQGQLQVALHTQHEEVARALRLVSHGLQEQLEADTEQRVSVLISTGHGSSSHQSHPEGAGQSADESSPATARESLTVPPTERHQDSTIILTI
ncbi:flagellar hook-length control protein FliK [Mangrovibacter sp. SLW1]